MAETKAHKAAKAKAAGRGGKTEAPLRGGGRLDARTKGGRKATEVERSGDAGKLSAAARRLRRSGAPQKVLQVPQRDMAKAREAMRRARIGGTVKNMSGKRSRVRKPK